MYSIAYGREKEHAAELKRGLEILGPNFLAEICGLCDGEGQYRQTYGLGCGMGTAFMVGGCDHCGFTGLRQGGGPAPASVRGQVLTAARREAA